MSGDREEGKEGRIGVKIKSTENSLTF